MKVLIIESICSNLRIAAEELNAVSGAKKPKIIEDILNWELVRI